MMPNRVAGTFARPSPHTTAYAGPNTAVRQRLDTNRSIADRSVATVLASPMVTPVVALTTRARQVSRSTPAPHRPVGLLNLAVELNRLNAYPCIRGLPSHPRPPKRDCPRFALPFAERSFGMLTSEKFPTSYRGLARHNHHAHAGRTQKNAPELPIGRFLKSKFLGGNRVILAVRWEELRMTTTQYDVFISYSHHDSDLARSLCAKLTTAGLRCFLAEKDVAAADRWEDRIRDALRNAERILLLITPNSKDSHWVVAEAGAAWVLGKRLVPALAYVKHNELITPIAAHQARTVHTPEEIDNLVRELSTDGSIVHGNVTGQWRDPTDGDIVYFRQSNSRIVGYYNLGRGNQKLGKYEGYIDNRVFDYHWRWLDGTHEGYGQMTLSPDGQRLSGEWWFGKQKDEVAHVGYRRISDEMPAWLAESDFNF